MWAVPRKSSPVRIQWRHARYAQTRGGADGGMLMAKTIALVCAQNYSVEQFIAPSLGLIPNPSSAPGPSGDWEGELRKSCGIKTLPPRL